jgi:putative ABC transport system ATP-binding protein
MSNGWIGPVVSLRDLTRVHGSGEGEVRALVGVSLDVAAGELVAVMGPSGSGKTTLLALTGGLDSPTAGNVVVEGVHLSELSKRELARLRRTSVGYVFQDYNLVPALTAAENVALPLELDGMRAGRARKLAESALEEVGLSGLGARFPDQMSGGQRQRTAIARALIGQRRLVLADEPTGALDSQTSEAVLKVLRARCDAGAAGILVTHEPRYAAYADRTIFLHDGRIVGSTGEYSNPDLDGGEALLEASPDEEIAR